MEHPNFKNENVDKSKRLQPLKDVDSKGGYPALTLLQSRVLSLILKEHLPQSEIAKRIGNSRQSVNQIVKRLQKYGHLEKQNIAPLLRGGVVTTCQRATWRYHKLHFTIHPYYFEPRYYQALKSGNIFYQGDWRFRLHRDMVEMQIRELVDFQSLVKWDALDKMTKSFNRWLNIVSNKYGFHVYKDGKANIKICDGHLECSNSGVAKGKGEGYIQIKGSQDNKTYFVFDTSKGTLNHEYTHPDRAISDSEKFEPFFQSMRDEPHYTPGETRYMLDTILSTQHEYAEQIKLHLKVQTKTLEVQNETLTTLKAIQQSLNRAESRELHTLKEEIKSMADLPKYKREISLLSESEKHELTGWLFERFGL